MASQAMIIPEVLPPRGSGRGSARSRYDCPYLGACPASCPARSATSSQLRQGIVAGGYTYVDPVTGVTTTITEPVAASGWQQELQLFLEETSPVFGLPWKWVLLGGALAYALFRKGGR